MNIWKIKIWLSQERKELSRRNKKHSSLLHRCYLLDIKNRLAKMQWTQPLKTLTLKNFMAPFMDGVQLPEGLSHFEEAVYFLPLSLQKFLALISISEGWKTELTLKPPSGFEHRTTGLGIQRLNHYQQKAYVKYVHIMNKFC